MRVGLEDYAGPRTPRNEERVAEVVALAEAEGALGGLAAVGGAGARRAGLSDGDCAQAGVR